MYILYMHVHTHIFIISKYEVKNTQVLYYITTIFAINVDAIEQRSYVIFVVFIHFALLFAIRTKVVRKNIKVIYF